MLKSTAKFIAIILLLAFGITNPTVAEDQMPPMGAPEQMKECDWLVGTWDVTQKFLMSDTADIWEESKGVAVYSKELNGCVLKMDFKSEMMGMPFTGTLLENYDRISGKWQSIWIDDMTARMSFYEGGREGDMMVMGGKDYDMDGSIYLARVTTFNETPDSFDWKFEMSKDEGKTYMVVGEAKYNKRK